MGEGGEEDVGVTTWGRSSEGREPLALDTGDEGAEAGDDGIGGDEDVEGDDGGKRGQSMSNSGRFSADRTLMRARSSRVAVACCEA